mmetsp:Transcript_21551/g.43611  ORF Transcript_21551/g.43611 Transcript_21551/m.43611 type:complete len:241 (-) Transcript_21551:104-826(-)
MEEGPERHLLCFQVDDVILSAAADQEAKLVHVQREETPRIVVRRTIFECEHVAVTAVRNQQAHLHGDGPAEAPGIEPNVRGSTKLHALAFARGVPLQMCRAGISRGGLVRHVDRASAEVPSVGWRRQPHNQRRHLDRGSGGVVTQAPAVLKNGLCAEQLQPAGAAAHAAGDLHAELLHGGVRGRMEHRDRVPRQTPHRDGRAAGRARRALGNRHLLLIEFIKVKVKHLTADPAQAAPCVG